MEKKVTDFINGKVVYSSEGQYFFIKSKDSSIWHLADLRGWSAIQNMFTKNNVCNETAAEQYQDKIGQFIADAINEKIEREFNANPTP